MADLMLLKSQQPGRAGFSPGGGAPAVSVNVKFVTAERPKEASISASAVETSWEDVPP